MNLSSLVASDYIELLILCKKKNHFFLSMQLNCGTDPRLVFTGSIYLLMATVNPRYSPL